MHDNFSPGTAYHVVCLLLALLVHFSGQQSCGQHAVCPGNRPPLPIGCCPVGAGQVCRPANSEDCDVELGYLCVDEHGEIVTEGNGTCRGRTNLRVTSNRETEVEVEWTGFAPPGYLFEYIIIYKAGNYSSDLSHWTRREIGDQPFYTLKRLTPATLYLIKIAVWEDAQAEVLGNTSETLIVETRGVEFCVYQGTNYLMGQPFIHNCEDNCTCLPTGEFECTPLCPERGVPEVQEGCYLTSGDGCCDYRVVCPVGGEPCQHRNETYSHGSEFQIGCRACTCSHGQLNCLYPSTCHVMEPTAACPHPKAREVDGQCCPEWYCASTCSYENQTYDHLEYFISAHCGLCQCDSIRGVQCATDCPPVVMVLPDTACPDPHVRQDGCCDTLYCYDPNYDVMQLLRRMFAMSYSPMSLTLSFEVDPESEVNGVPLYCEYEVMYSNASYPYVTWHRRLVQPVDVRLHHDQSQDLDPTEALTRDNAIVVGDRAYVTLSGMHPNTTYYVKVIPLDGRQNDMVESESDSFNSSDNRRVAMVVVKTLPLENATSCFHNGKEVLHGASVDRSCHLSCLCVLGEIRCQSVCEAESYIVAASPSCPQPRLETQDGACCPQWNCYPSATGCSHNGLLMESGQSVREACRVCTCSNASVQCSSVCPATGQAPRPSCQLVNISGHCCPQWKCPVESHFPYGIQASVSFHFSGVCKSPNSNFSDDLQKQVFHYVMRHMRCSDNQSQLSPMCDARHVQIKVICQSINDDFFKKRRRRSALENSESQKIPVIVSIGKNFSSSVPDEMTVLHVHVASMQVFMLLNSTFLLTLTDGQTLTSLADARLEGLSYICDEKFTFLKGSCVLSEIESSLSFKPTLKMSVTHISSSSVLLQWSPLEETELQQITGLLVEYRKDGNIQWQASGRLDSTSTSLVLTLLEAEGKYLVRLVAITPWLAKGRWDVAEIQFRTRPATDITSATPAITLQEVSVSDTQAFLYWQQLSEPVAEKVTSMSVLYKPTILDHYTHKHRIFFVRDTLCILDGLQPDTSYTAEIAILLHSGMSLTTHPVHFLTKSSASRRSAEPLVAIIIPCVVAAVAMVVAMVTCVMWRRSSRREQCTGFENKIYGIQLENNNDENHVTPTANPAVN